MWALFILVICNISFGDVGKSNIFFPGFDKLVHCGLFFVLTVFISNGNIRQSGALNFTIVAALKAFIIAIVFGGLIELLQLYIFTWRSGEWNDLFADSVGAGMGVFSVLITLYAATHEKN